LGILALALRRAASGLAIEKTDQTIALAQWKSAQDNGFRLLEWHSFSDWLYAEPTPLSARRPAVTNTPVKLRDGFWDFVTYHTKRRDAIENHTEKENLPSFSVNRTTLPAQMRAAATRSTATDTDDFIED